MCLRYLRPQDVQVDRRPRLVRSTTRLAAQSHEALFQRRALPPRFAGTHERTIVARDSERENPYRETSYATGDAARPRPASPPSAQTWFLFRRVDRAAAVPPDYARRINFAAIQPSSINADRMRSEEHTSELQSPCNLVCRLLLEKKKNSITL